MTPEELKSIAESLIFAAGNPISLRRLAEVIGVAQADVKPALSLLRQEYEAAGRGIIFAEVAGGYQLRTAPVHAEYVKMLLQEKPSKLSRAALETLAIIAYRQPITKIEIESVRGVTVDGVLNSLLTKKLIREMGRKDVPGRPWVYGTTPQFLELFGLTDLNSLPPLPDIHEPTLNPLIETDAEDVAEPNENGAVQELQEDMQEENGVPHRNGEDTPNETITQPLEANDQNNQDIPQDVTPDNVSAQTEAGQAVSEEADLVLSSSEQDDGSVHDQIRQTKQANPADQSSVEPVAAAAETNGEATSGTIRQSLEANDQDITSDNVPAQTDQAVSEEADFVLSSSEQDDGSVHDEIDQTKQANPADQSSVEPIQAAAESNETAASNTRSEQADLAPATSEQAGEPVHDEIDQIQQTNQILQANPANQGNSEPIGAAAESSEASASSGTPEQTLGASGDSVQASGGPSDPSRESPGERSDDHPTGDDGGSET